MGEWKPGDVAIVRTREHGEQVGIRTSSEFTGKSEFFVVPGFTYATDSQARPLVVIDPEDRDRVDRLVSLFEAVRGDSLYMGDNDHMQAALREFAQPQPVKPDEPMGLGAVVVDADGVTWVRAEVGECGWLPVGIPGPFRCWSEFAPVRILSEGVTEDGAS